MQEQQEASSNLAYHLLLADYLLGLVFKPEDKGSIVH
jgi:hypothetical protein